MVVAMNRSDECKHLEEQLAPIASVVGGAVAEAAPGTGWALLMFDFGERGSVAYASNAKRPDMVRMLRELASQLEGS
jgi:hypothetical protein